MASKGHRTVKKGADEELVFRLEDADGDPFDVTGNTETKCILLKENSGLITLLRTASKVIFDSEVGGKGRVILDNDLALRVDERQDFEIEVTLASGKLKVFDFQEALTVEARLAG